MVCNVGIFRSYGSIHKHDRFLPYCIVQKDSIVIIFTNQLYEVNILEQVLSMTIVIKNEI